MRGGSAAHAAGDRETEAADEPRVSPYRITPSPHPTRQNLSPSPQPPCHAAGRGKSTSFGWLGVAGARPGSDVGKSYRRGGKPYTTLSRGRGGARPRGRGAWRPGGGRGG